MFVVKTVGTPYKNGWFRRETLTAVRFEALEDMECEFLGRTFQGHGTYSTQQYRVTVRKGESFLLGTRGGYREGDLRSLEVLVGEGYFRNIARLVATSS
ncbi:hypothetical protein [Roseococcus sp. YIM B11640]|uniref:hypothetical protein n=1 Tax=Roseococcus sp. YIM B11640 TaxID=3133973 RepID=UPI003C7A7F97